MSSRFKEIKYNSPDWTNAVSLRERILREPLGRKFTTQELDEEKSHIQIGGFLNNELIATAVIVPEGNSMKMQRVVVAEGLRNKKIGSKMMKFCETLASKNGVQILYCHARDSAIDFYLSNNYKMEGNYFEEDGIPHMKMIKKLN